MFEETKNWNWVSEEEWICTQEEASLLLAQREAVGNQRYGSDGPMPQKDPITASNEELGDLIFYMRKVRLQRLHLCELLKYALANLRPDDTGQEYFDWFSEAQKELANCNDTSEA